MGEAEEEEEQEQQKRGAHLERALGSQMETESSMCWYMCLYMSVRIRLY